MHKLSRIPVLLIVISSFAAAQAQKPSGSPSPLVALNFLLGNWVGEGSGQPGRASGEFSFRHDLDGRILFRTNFAEYPATADRPAFRHDDFMITYSEGGALRAIYFDSEGHVIRYDVATSANSAVFLSEPPGPHYRLSYTAKNPNQLFIKFEIAPPDKPDEFSSYIEASAHRR
jgi:hypothetical protein